MGDEAAQPVAGVADAQREVAAFVASRDVLCPACGHNLRGSTGATCPECGVALRLGVVADRLARGSWFVCAALSLLSVALLAFSGLKLYPMIKTITSPWIRLPASSWISVALTLGLGIAGAGAATRAWVAYRQADRTGLSAAYVRSVMIVCVLGVYFFIRSYEAGVGWFW